ncbi:hypothetical protein SQ11_11165 [Nitrosospira sp. NpAV]|nr:hypothetical protein SQ11_11165 [Nitrosospira sp. NpAV]
MVDSLLNRLRSYLQPAIGTFLHVRIVSLRIAAIMPIIDGGRWWRWFHHCLLRLLLNIYGWRLRHGHNRRVPIIRGVIGHSKTIAAITPPPTAIITRPESAETKTRIKTSYANETYPPMMMVPAVVMMPAAMMPSTMVTSPIASASPSISPAALLRPD